MLLCMVAIVVSVQVPGAEADSASSGGGASVGDGGRSRYLPVPARDRFHTYVVHFIAGRTDGSTRRAGAIAVWADGVDKPVINLRNINTLQRANGVTQKWMQLWEGDYTRALTKVARQSFVLTRVGRTLADALADRPVAIGTTAEGQIFTGSGSDLGPPTAVEISPRRASAARIPASLGGNRSSDVPLQTWEITLKPSYVSENDGIASNYQAVWVYPKSPTTPYRSPDSHHQQSRYLLLDPRARDSDGRAGRDDWWFVIERNWPTGFDQYEHGAWGMFVNFHNVAGDVGWSTGSPVSALALTWGRTPAPSFALEYNDGKNVVTPRKPVAAKPSGAKAKAVTGVRAHVDAAALAGGSQSLRRAHH